MTQEQTQAVKVPHMDDVIDTGEQPHETPDKRTIARLEAEVAGLKEQLKDFHDSIEIVLKEPCGTELHCTCVPLLKVEVAELKAALRAIVDGDTNDIRKAIVRVRERGLLEE